jgi:hypothetical protein
MGIVGLTALPRVYADSVFRERSNLKDGAIPPIGYQRESVIQI